MRKKFFLLALSFIFIISGFAFLNITQAQTSDKKMDIYVFTQTGCPYCAKTISFLQTLKNKEYPHLNIHQFNVKNKPEYEKFVQFTAVYQTSPEAIPITFIGDKFIKGYKENELRSAVEFCSLPVNKCLDAENFVNKKLQEIMPKEQQFNFEQERDKKFIGWIVLAVGAIGGGVLLINKL